MNTGTKIVAGVLTSVLFLGMLSIPTVSCQAGQAETNSGSEVDLSVASQTQEWVKLGMVLDSGSFSPGVQYPFVLEENGVYKMWYTGLNLPHGEIYYATSLDGVNWTEEGCVLSTPSDLVYTVAPSVLIEDDGTYKMWYSSQDYSWKARTYLATSNDGINWAEQGIAIDIGPSGSPDSLYAVQAKVFMDDGLYKMYYKSYDDDKNRYFMYATSTDSYSWTKHGVVMDLQPGYTNMECPYVVKNENGTYTMWYHASKDCVAIHIAYSTDGFNWTQGGVDLDVGEPGELDDALAYCPYVLEDSATGIDSMYYAGSDGSNTRIFLAVKSDGTNNQSPVADAGPDQTVDTNIEVQFDGSGSYDPDGTIVNYEWDFGDGTSYTSTSTEVVDIEQITDAPYGMSDPNWSPDGQKIAVCEVDSGRYADIVVMNSDGTGQQQLTSTPTLHERFPAFSPNGTKLAYVKGTVDTKWGDYDVWVMDVDGSNPVQLTTDPADDRNPIWSPDGSKIFFESARTGSYEFWVMANEGSNLVKLNDGISRACKPDISHDGKKVVFSSDASGTHEIVTLDLDTNTTQTLTSDSTVHNYYPSWSPDSTYIQFTKASLDHQASNLWIMSADGANQTQITFDSGRNELADWSPDGQKIAYRSNQEGGPCQIFVATLGGNPYASHVYTEPGTYTVTLTVTDDDGATAQNTCTITVLTPPTNANLTITKVKTCGPDVVETHTCYGWTLEITVTNLGGSDATEVIMYDVLPAELDLVSYTITQGTFAYAQNGQGQMGSTSLTWNIGTISPGDNAVLTLVISTTTNPAGQQEFTSPGNYSLNDGAWVTGIDSLTGEELAAGPTPPITVVAVDPDDEEGEDEDDDDDLPEEPENEENEVEINDRITLGGDNSPSDTGAIENMENKANKPSGWPGIYALILLFSAVTIIGAALVARLEAKIQHEKMKELDMKLLKGEISEDTYLQEMKNLN